MWLLAHCSRGWLLCWTYTCTVQCTALYTFLYRARKRTQLCAWVAAQFQFWVCVGLNMDGERLGLAWLCVWSLPLVCWIKLFGFEDFAFLNALTSLWFLKNLRSVLLYHQTALCSAAACTKERSITHTYYTHFTCVCAKVGRTYRTGTTRLCVFTIRLRCVCDSVAILNEGKIFWTRSPTRHHNTLHYTKTQRESRSTDRTKLSRVIVIALSTSSFVYIVIALPLWFDQIFVDFAVYLRVIFIF